MFKIDRTLLKPNISRTIRFTQPLYEWVQMVSERENISFNQVVLQCCKNGLDDDLDGKEEP